MGSNQQGPLIPWPATSRSLPPDISQRKWNISQFPHPAACRAGLEGGGRESPCLGENGKNNMNSWCFVLLPLKGSKRGCLVCS